MGTKIERLGSVRNGKPVVAIDPELLERLEKEEEASEQKEETVAPRASGVSLSEKIVKPKLGG